MKTYVYVNFSGPRGGRRVETGSRVPDNCDCVASLGRKPNEDELIGTGRNREEALRDAMDQAWAKYYFLA